jgi:hypothetical protein
MERGSRGSYRHGAGMKWQEIKREGGESRRHHCAQFTRVTGAGWETTLTGGSHLSMGGRKKEYRFGRFSLLGHGPTAGLGRKCRPSLLLPFFWSVLLFSFSVFLFLL